MRAEQDDVIENDTPSVTQEQRDSSGGKGSINRMIAFSRHPQGRTPQGGAEISSLLPLVGEVPAQRGIGFSLPHDYNPHLSRFARHLSHAGRDPRSVTVRARECAHSCRNAPKIINPWQDALLHPFERGQVMERLAVYRVILTLSVAEGEGSRRTQSDPCFPS